MKPTTVLVAFASLGAGAVVGERAPTDERGVLSTRGSPHALVSDAALDEPTAGHVKVTKPDKVASSAQPPISTLASKRNVTAATRLIASSPYLLNMQKSRNSAKDTVEFCSRLSQIRWVVWVLGSYAKTAQPIGMKTGHSIQRARALFAVEMMENWQNRLKKLEVWLDGTKSFSNQMMSASCYVEYGRRTSKWLATMREALGRFPEGDPARKYIGEGIKLVAARHMAVAQRIHGNDCSLITERVPENDKTGAAACLRSKYCIKAGQSLGKWVRDNDPIYPISDGGVFREVALRWRWRVYGPRNIVAAVNSPGKCKDLEEAGLIPKHYQPTDNEWWATTNGSTGIWGVV